MSTVKIAAVTITIYGFLAYLIIGMFKPSLPLPIWAVGLYFALAIAVSVWAMEEEDTKAKIWTALALFGILGGVATLYMVSRVF